MAFPCDGREGEERKQEGWSALADGLAVFPAARQGTRPRWRGQGAAPGRSGSAGAAGGGASGPVSGRADATAFMKWSACPMGLVASPKW